MKRYEHILIALAFAAVLVGCSSTPERIGELEQARSLVESVENSPDAGRYAADEVQAAHEALRKADNLVEDEESVDSIRQAAYLARRHAEIAQQQIARGQAQAATEQAEAERQRVLLQAREQEAAARQRQAAAAAAQAEQQARLARADAAMLQEQLRELQARETDRGLVLTLGDVLFDTDKASLKPGGMSSVERLAQFLEQAPRRTVTIEGHTDSTGPDSYNQSLSENRADAVKAALVAEGIAPSRIDAVGKGESVPVASNDTAAGRQQNRRVEIIISTPAEVASRP